MKREQVFKYVLQKYQTQPEYLWRKYPSYAVLRHSNNQKWYALVMLVPQANLGLAGRQK